MNEITTKQLEEKLAANEDILLIDVREEEEIAEGKIANIIHIPLGEIPERMAELDKEQHYYIICRSGGRSGRACEFLKENGFKTTNIAGGMLEWEGKTE